MSYNKGNSSKNVTGASVVDGTIDSVDFANPLTGDVSLGDGVKAKFGAGNDLQIYHDGSNSYIKDAGTGSLRLRGTDLRLESSTLVHNFILCSEGGGVSVFHNDLSKLATTSTGIDVTGSVTCDGFTSTGIDDNATSTAITIDASENVLVGKTVTSSDTAGMLIGANGRFDAIRDGGYVGYFNRLSSDGDIALFAKDGTTVGSIGAATSTLTIDGHSTGSGLYFATNYILPRKSGVLSDNTIDIGDSARHFKDLYLSGNVVIGTSGKGIDFSADGNAAGMTSEVLDDYETGTWTPSNSFTTSTGTYTKIGNRVFCELYVANWTGDALTTVLDLGSLPFTVVTTFNSPCAYTRMTPRFSGRVYAYNTTATALRLRENNNGTYDQHVIHSMLQALTGIKMHFNYDVA